MNSLDSLLTPCRKLWYLTGRVVQNMASRMTWVLFEGSFERIVPENATLTLALPMQHSHIHTDPDSIHGVQKKVHRLTCCSENPPIHTKTGRAKSHVAT